MLAIAAAGVGDGPFYDVISTLPEGNQPLWWSREHLDEIRGTMLHMAVAESQDELEATTDMLCMVLKKEGLGCEALRRARTSALEDAFVMNSDMLFIPVVHLAKRRLASAGGGPSLQQDDDGFIWVSSGTGIEDGDGSFVPDKLKMDQLQLLWHFGAVVHNNPNSIVYKVFRGRNTILRHIEANTGGVGTQWFARHTRALEAMGEKFTITSAEPPWEYAMAIRILACEVHALDCGHLFTKPRSIKTPLLDMEQEQEVWSATAQAFRSHLERYRGASAGEDILASTQRHWHRHKRLALAYRALEKMVVQANLRFCEERVTELTKGHHGRSAGDPEL